MNNLILRANILDVNVKIQHVVLPLPLVSNVVEVIVSPKQGYVLSSSNVSHGSLPPQVSSIDFSQSGANVIASVTISKFINNKTTQNVSLPLMVVSKLNVDHLKLVDRDAKSDDKVVVTSMSTYLKSKVSNGISYNVTCSPGETKLLLSKTFTVLNKYYFTSGPNYRVIGNSERYTAKEDVSRDSKGRIIRKKLNIYYSSPANLDETNNEDLIEFSYKTASKTYDREVKDATKKEEYEIYSFDEGRKIGTEGGVKIMTVRGLPGTEFKLVVQDNTNLTYNFTKGVFEAGGGMLVATIPPAMPGVGYGQYKAFVKIPRSSGDKSYKTSMGSDKPIDHVALQQAVVDARESTDSTSSALSTSGSSAIAQIKVLPALDPASGFQEITDYTSATFNFTTTGFTAAANYDPLPDKLKISKEGYPTMVTNIAKSGSTSKSLVYRVEIKPSSDSQFIEIEREPRSIEGKDFVNWDSGSNKAEGLNSAGVEILNDWFTSDEDLKSGVKFTSHTQIQPYGKGKIVNGKSLYPSIIIEGQIDNIVHGNRNTVTTLDLLNFLTLHNL